METFSALLAICARNSPVPGEFPTQRPVTWSFDVYFDLCLNKRLCKHSWGWWFGTLLCPLWCYSNEISGQSEALNQSWCVRKKTAFIKNRFHGNLKSKCKVLLSGNMLDGIYHHPVRCSSSNVLTGKTHHPDLWLYRPLMPRPNLLVLTYKHLTTHRCILST